MQKYVEYRCPRREKICKIGLNNVLRFYYYLGGKESSSQIVSVWEKMKYQQKTKLILSLLPVNANNLNKNLKASKSLSKG